MRCSTWRWKGKGSAGEASWPQKLRGQGQHEAITHWEYRQWQCNASMSTHRRRAIARRRQRHSSSATRAATAQMNSGVMACSACERRSGGVVATSSGPTRHGSAFPCQGESLACCKGREGGGRAGRSHPAEPIGQSWAPGRPWACRQVGSTLCIASSAPTPHALPLTQRATWGEASSQHTARSCLASCLGISVCAHDGQRITA